MCVCKDEEYVCKEVDEYAMKESFVVTRWQVLRVCIFCEGPFHKKNKE